ncbi:MAG: hypothetical protein J3K34DRAFT_450474 [Monoraphidium minutum]|nr:MAG: hypothetical protein J3K34DRAFT_450474 [Monoraphidium minutum]
MAIARSFVAVLSVETRCGTCQRSPKRWGTRTAFLAVWDCDKASRKWHMAYQSSNPSMHRRTQYQVQFLRKLVYICLLSLVTSYMCMSFKIKMRCTYLPASSPIPPHSPKIRLFSIQRNAVPFLKDWFTYHSKIFGAGAINMVDHKSTDEETIKYMDYMRSLGAKVQLFSGSFHNKHEILTDIMRVSDAAADILIPLDIDEFIVKLAGKNFTTSPDGILSSLRHLSLIGDGRRFRFRVLYAVPNSTCVEGLAPANCIHTFLLPAGDRYTCSSKSFYPRNGFVATDQGNHAGTMEMDTHDMLSNFTVFAPASPTWGPKSCPFFHVSDLAIIHYGSYLPWELYKQKNLHGAKEYNHTTRLTCAGTQGEHYCDFYKDFVTRGEAAVRSTYLASFPLFNINNREIVSMLRGHA